VLLSGSVYASTALYASVPLPTLIGAMRSFRKISLMYKQEAMTLLQAPCMQCALNFCTPSADPCVLTGEAIVEEEYLQQANASSSSNKSLIPVFMLYKILLASWFHNYSLGEKLAKAIHKYNLDTFNVSNFTSLYLHQGLIYSALARGGRSACIRTTRKCLKQLQYYASYCPVNVMNKVRLIEAEIDVYEMKIKDAMAKYDEAWHLAHTEERWRECGLICEHAARALEYAGKTSEANAMLRKAMEAYQKWGATVKVDILTRQLS
jgi:hypothetical protein